MSKKISNTKRSGLIPARVERNRIDNLYFLLLDLIKNGEIGQEFENFFARPKDVPSDKSIDWYIELDGGAISFSSLDKNKKFEAVQKFEEIKGKLNSFADTLDKKDAAILRAALVFPDQYTKYLYLVGDQIVATCWGFSSSESSLAKDSDLEGEIKERLEEIKDEVSEYIEKKKDECATASAAEAADVSKDQVQQTGSTVEPDAQVETEVTSSDTTNTQNTPSTDTTSTDTKSEDTQAGDPATADPQSSDASSPSAPTQPAPKSWLLPTLVGSALTLAGAVATWYFMFHKPAVDPESEQRDKQSLSFLKGDLEVKGVLENEKGEKVDLSLNFAGEDGKGLSFIKSKKQVCQGKVTAHLGSENNVVMELTTLTCPDGNNFDAFTLVCVKGKSDCVGTNKDGTSWKIDMNQK